MFVYSSFSFGEGGGGGCGGCSGCLGWCLDLTKLKKGQGEFRVVHEGSGNAQVRVFRGSGLQMFTPFRALAIQLRPSSGFFWGGWWSASNYGPCGEGLESLKPKLCAKGTHFASA